MSNDRVGFVGLGNMGGRMARCLTAAGYELVGYDTRAENMRAAGARAAGSPGEVIESSDIVLLSLPDSHVVEDVVFGDNGLLRHSCAGQIVVDLSTASPASTKRICAEFAERDVAYIDAGISGGAAAAEKGQLTLMVGGEASRLDAARPVLDCVAADIFHLGPSGSGHTTKLLNNFLNAIALSATAEVMVAARKAELDLETVLEVLNKSSGVNFATLNRFPRIIHGDYLEGGLTSTLMLKDLTLFLEMLTELGVTSLHSSGPVAAFGLARALGYADQISNRVVDAIGDVSGGVRINDGGGR